MDLTEYRAKIDEIDGALLRLFEQRMTLAGEIGQWKQENNLPVFQPEREAQKLAGLKKQADPELLPYETEFFRTLFALSRKYQESRLQL